MGLIEESGKYDNRIEGVWELLMDIFYQWIQRMEIPIVFPNQTSSEKWEATSHFHAKGQ